MASSQRQKSSSENDSISIEYRLQQMHLSSESKANEYHRPPSVLENLTRDTHNDTVTKYLPNELYKSYERNNIAAAKYDTPKPIEQLVSNNENIYELKQPSPVYENLDFYSGAQFDSNNTRAQPQSPQSNYVSNSMNNRVQYLPMQGAINSRYAHTPVPDVDHTPIYENVIPHSGQRAQPQASPATATIYQLVEMQQQHSSHHSLESPNSLHSHTDVPTQLAGPQHRRSTSNTSLKTNMAAVSASPNQRYRNLSLPSHLMSQNSVPNSKVSDYQAQNVKLNQIPQSPMHHIPNRLSSPKPGTMAPSQMGINISLNPNYIEDINSSDYVCMTANLNRKPPPPAPQIEIHSQPKEIIQQHQQQTAMGVERASSAGMRSPSLPPTAISPTPSQGSTGLSKNLLPYSVTPPRPAGPTEAQRKIEELTRQLEEEIELSEEHGEYFGE